MTGYGILNKYFLKNKGKTLEEIEVLVAEKKMSTNIYNELCDKAFREDDEKQKNELLISQCIHGKSKMIGTNREITSIGRIGIPKDILKANNWNPSEEFEFTTRGTDIIIKKHTGDEINGFIRVLEPLGRFIIPVQIRNSVGARTGVRFEMIPWYGELILRKIKD